MILTKVIKGAGFGLPLFLLASAFWAQDRNAAAWMAAGAESATRGDYLHAEESFHRACLLNPKLPDACLYFGRTLYLLDRFAEAIGVLRNALESGPPATAETYRILALSLEALGKSAEAESAFLDAVKLDRNLALNEDPAIDYGVFLYRQGRAQAALAPLQAAVKRHPDAARAQLELGCVLLALDRVDDAAAHLARAASLEPAVARAHLLLAKAYQRLGKTELAAKELSQGSRTVK